LAPQLFFPPCLAMLATFPENEFYTVLPPPPPFFFSFFRIAHCRVNTEATALRQETLFSSNPPSPTEDNIYRSVTTSLFLFPRTYRLRSFPPAKSMSLLFSGSSNPTKILWGLPPKTPPGTVMGVCPPIRSSADMLLLLAESHNPLPTILGVVFVVPPR